MSQGCMMSSKKPLVPNHQNTLLSETLMPMSTHQATKVATENATVTA